jgi:hypothetical protein
VVCGPPRKAQLDKWVILWHGYRRSGWPNASADNQSGDVSLVASALIQVPFPILFCLSAQSQQIPNCHPLVRLESFCGEP